MHWHVNGRKEKIQGRAQAGFEWKADTHGPKMYKAKDTSTDTHPPISKTDDSRREEYVLPIIMNNWR